MSCDTVTMRLGSHYDTVIDGSAFDGTLGIISAICAVKHLLQQASYWIVCLKMHCSMESRRICSDCDLAILLLGSHYDTVIDGLLCKLF